MCYIAAIVGKSLALAGFLVAVLSLHGQQSGRQPNNGTQWTVPCLVRQDAAAPVCDWSQAKPQGYFRRLIAPENAPNIALFIVGVVGTFIALMTLGKIKRQADLMGTQAEHMREQLEEMKRQAGLMNTQASHMAEQVTEMRLQREQTVEEMRRQAYQMGEQAAATYSAARAAENTVNAALKQIEAHATAERAWLVIRSSMPERWVPNTGIKFEFWWAVRNTGNTPARILETQCRFFMVRAETLYSLPTTPRYLNPISPAGYLLAPGDAQGYSTFLENESGHPVVDMDQTDVNTIRMGLYFLCAYGYVLYLDAFDRRRESRFCEYYVWSDDRQARLHGFQPLIGAPSEYTKCT